MSSRKTFYISYTKVVDNFEVQKQSDLQKKLFFGGKLYLKNIRVVFGSFPL